VKRLIRPDGPLRTLIPGFGKRARSRFCGSAARASGVASLRGRCRFAGRVCMGMQRGAPDLPSQDSKSWFRSGFEAEEGEGGPCLLWTLDSGFGLVVAERMF